MDEEFEKIKRCRIEDTDLLSWDEKLQYRLKGLGGSDISGVLNISKYKSQAEIYYEKTSENYVNTPPTEAMRLGVVLEPYIKTRVKEYFKEHYNKTIEVREEKFILRNNNMPFMLANVDGLIFENDILIGGLECKSTANRGNKNLENDIPQDYLAQCLHYMAVTGLNIWYLAIYEQGKAFYLHKIQHTPEITETIMQKAKQFWEENVLKRIPPISSVDYSKEFIELLYPTPTDETIEIEQTFEEKLEKLENIKEKIKLLDNEKEDIEKKIQLKLANATYGICGNYNISWKTQERKTLDTPRLKKEHPEIYEDYKKISNYRVLSIKRKRGEIYE